MRHRLFLIGTLLLFAFSMQVNGQANGPSSVKKTIDSFVNARMKETGIVGLGAAIIIDKKLVWAKGYGYADKENNIPFTPATIMNIASISKTFTGVCIMKAAEEGKLSLDEDINNYLPFKIIHPGFPGEKITLRQLATHTSSLADRYPFYDDSTYFYNGATPEALGVFLENYFVAGGKHYSKDNFLPAKPGTFREYSNIGAGLAGYIVELRTGKKLNAYARQNIFVPLAMNHSGWAIADVDMRLHSKLYAKKGNVIEPIHWYEGSTYPDGGVRTSVEELSKFFIALLNEGNYNGKQMLTKQSIDEMLRFQFDEKNKPVNVKPENLNSGIFWSTKMSGTRIGHNGSDPGVRTFMLSDGTKEIAIIVFMNTSLTEKEDGKFFEIYSGLYKYAAGLKK